MKVNLITENKARCQGLFGKTEEIPRLPFTLQIYRDQKISVIFTIASILRLQGSCVVFILCRVRKRVWNENDVIWCQSKEVK